MKRPQRQVHLIEDIARPGRAVEVAQVLGLFHAFRAHHQKTLAFKVTLPLSLPGVISGISMMFMPIFSSYAITKMMGDMNTTVIGAKIAALFENQNYGSYGYGSALSFVLLLIVLAVMLVGNALTRRAPKAPKGGKA